MVVHTCTYSVIERGMFEIVKQHFWRLKLKRVEISVYASFRKQITRTYGYLSQENGTNNRKFNIRIEKSMEMPGIEFFIFTTSKNEQVCLTMLILLLRWKHNYTYLYIFVILF